MYDIVCQHTISYIMYDIVCQTGRRMFYTTSYINIRCRTLYIRHRMSVLKAPSIDFKFSKDPRPRRVHMAIGFPTPCTIFSPGKQCWYVRNTVSFYIKNGYCHTPIRLPCDLWTVQTPSLGVREPRCTVPVAVGCFYPDIQGARVGGLTSTMVLQPWTVLSSSPV